MAGGTEGTGGTGGSGGAGGGGGANGAADPAVFEAALARMTEAANQRLLQDARRTETQEIIGAAKQAAQRTSA